MALYKYVQNIDPYNYTNAIELERNAAGEVTKALGVGEVEDLTAVQVDRLSQFAILEAVSSSSNDEAETVAKPEDKSKTDRNKSDKPQGS